MPPEVGWIYIRIWDHIPSQFLHIDLQASIIGLVVEFVVAIDEARVRFTDDAQQFIFCSC
ncbi:hypothetical protein N7471_004811 [Penicillium samsonianum]|uniref:uncharacterized protein n=1 Tax=Penicillium samsonianum TaxID=1882272 RepID=UPI002547B253|nr:uncharacterized protein N7471_004811 [Penicillium samsonianum]KAJ6138325.1 hypothetical protein N7471_004811 [Penicillium samsonianum]